jgi:nucleotide-binding universal stress UspA family protein
VSLVMLALAVVVLVFGLLVADLSIYLEARARAQMAADAAALAAAPVTFRPFGASGSAADEARRFAGRNGAALIECRCVPDPSWRSRTVIVRVSVPADLVLLGATEATGWSSAEFDPTRLGR